MPTFDKTLTIEAPPSVIASTLRASLTTGEPMIAIAPDVICVWRGLWGYAYILRPQPDGSTQVRLVVDTAANVDRVFKDKPVDEGIAALDSIPANEDNRLSVESA